MTWRIAGPEWTWWSKATSIPVQQPLERSASTVVPQKFWWSLVMKFTSLRLGGWRFQPICKNIVKLDHGSLSRDKTTFYRKPPPRFIHLNSWIFKCKLFSKHTHTHTICTLKSLKHWSSTSCPLGKNTFGQRWEILHSTQSLMVPHTFVDCKRGSIIG